MPTKVLTLTKIFLGEGGEDTYLHLHIDSQIDKVILIVWVGTLETAEITPNRCPIDSNPFRDKVGLGRERGAPK